MGFYSGLDRSVTDKRPLLLSIFAIFRIPLFSAVLWRKSFLDFNSSKSKLNDNSEWGNFVISDIFQNSVAFFVFTYHQLV